MKVKLFYLFHILKEKQQKIAKNYLTESATNVRIILSLS